MSTAMQGRWFRRAAAVVALAMVATACGGGDDDGGDGSTSGEDAGTPTPGGTVVYGLEAETTDGWCLPEAQLAISGIMVAQSIYDTLTRPNADGEIEPWLAESVEPNEDSTAWTIKLREGITFHDDSPLTAEVVKNNLDAYRGAYPARSPQLFIFVFAPIESVEVVDPLTVQVNLNQPWVSFDAALHGSGRVGMLAQAQLDDPSTCSDNLIGTGPFVKTEWVQNQKFVAEKNPNYWATDEAGEQLPYLDSIEFRPIVEVEQRRQRPRVRRDQRHAHERGRDRRRPPWPGRVGHGERVRVRGVRRGQLRDVERVEAAVRQHQGPPGARPRPRLRGGQRHPQRRHRHPGDRPVRPGQHRQPRGQRLPDLRPRRGEAPGRGVRGRERPSPSSSPTPRPTPPPPSGRRSSSRSRSRRRT